MREFVVWREWTERWLVPVRERAVTPQEALARALRQPVDRRGQPARIDAQEAWVTTPAGTELLTADQCHELVVAAARRVA